MLAHLSHNNVVGYHGAWLEYVTTDNIECAIPSKFNVCEHLGWIFWSFLQWTSLNSYRVSLFQYSEANNISWIMVSSNHWLRSIQINLYVSVVVNAG